jgi:hypothetical protein
MSGILATFVDGDALVPCFPFLFNVSVVDAPLVPSQNLSD